MAAMSRNLNGRVNRLAKLLGEGALWDGAPHAELACFLCVEDVPDNQLSPGVWRFRYAMGSWAMVNLLIGCRDHPDYAEDRQEAAEVLGIEDWEDPDAEAIRRRALVVAEEEIRLTEAELRWLYGGMTSPRPGEYSWTGR
jgi:hypothetical protein